MTKEELKEQIDELVKTNGKLKAVDFNPLLKLMVDMSDSGAGLDIGTTSITSGTGTNLLYNDNGVLSEVPGLRYDKTTNTFSYIENNAGLLFGKHEFAPEVFIGIKGIFDMENNYINALTDLTPLGGQLQSFFGFNNQVDVNTSISIKHGSMVSINADENVNIDAKENVNLNSANVINLNADENMNLNATKGISITTGNDYNDALSINTTHLFFMNNTIEFYTANHNSELYIKPGFKTHIHSSSSLDFRAVSFEIDSEIINIKRGGHFYDSLGKDISSSATVSDLIDVLADMGLVTKI